MTYITTLPQKVRYNHNYGINDDLWAVLIALASLIIAATVAAIILVCVLWSKYAKNLDRFNKF